MVFCLPVCIMSQSKGTISINGRSMDLQTYLDSIKYNNLPPMLTTEEMYADFDTLITIMQQCNPQCAVIKTVTGHDMIKELKILRNQIEHINNTFDFIKLVKKGLSLSIRWSSFYCKWHVCFESIL
jgi:hypothetical protein